LYIIEQHIVSRRVI